jgi:hypothetical protein
MEENVTGPIYAHYRDTACVGNPTKKYCSLRQLTYSQWAFGNVMSNPMDSFPRHIEKDNYYSYIRDFPHFPSVLTFTPELSYFIAKSEMPVFDLNLL